MMTHKTAAVYAIVAALACQSLCAQDIAEASEPNNSPATATVLPTGSQGFGEIANATDLDYWLISVSGNTDILVSLSTVGKSVADGGVGLSDGRLEIRLVDGVTVIDRNKDYYRNEYFEFSRMPRVSTTVVAGDYLVVVGGEAVLGAQHALGRYRLDVSTSPSTACGTLSAALEGSEPNEHGAVPGPTTLVGCSEVFGLIGHPGDVDWYRVVLSSAESLRVSADPWGAPHLPNPEILLFDAAGQTELDGDDNRELADFAADLKVELVPGTYYIVIRSSSEATGDIGGYRLRLRSNPVSVYGAGAGCGTFTPTTEPPEPNDLLGGVPGTLACCAEVSGSIGSTGDVDSYVLTVAYPSRVTIASSPLGASNPLPAAWLILEDEDGATIGTPDMDVNVEDGSIERELRVGIYHLSVSGADSWGAPGTGDYLLSVDCEPLSATPPSRADAQVIGVGCPSSTGIPVDIDVDPNEMPWADTPFDVRLSDIPSGSSGSVLLNVAADLPGLDLGVIGAPGCALTITTALVTLPVAIEPFDPTMGRIQVSLAGLAGHVIYFQGVVLDANANPLGLVTSSTLRATVGY